MSTAPASLQHTIAFIGGGNMASAILGGLLRQGLAPAQVQVVEPFADARERLAREFGVAAHEHAGPFLARRKWWSGRSSRRPFATPPSRSPATPHRAAPERGRRHPLGQHRAWTGNDRVVRSMPNTPALVGRGMTALFARDAVTAADRQVVEQVLAPTGATLWVDAEQQLDAVTALSGSGPAYVFYFIEAMARPGAEMGLPPTRRCSWPSAPSPAPRNWRAPRAEAAGRAARAGDVQGRHDLRGAHLAAAGCGGRQVRRRHARRLPPPPNWATNSAATDALPARTRPRCRRRRRTRPSGSGGRREAAFARAVADQRASATAPAPRRRRRPGQNGRPRITRRQRPPQTARKAA
jgi:hypothetical protein